VSFPVSPLLAVLAVLAAVTLATDAAADCTCRAQGRDFDLGRSVCLNTPAGFRLATCDMVLNNTSWRISATPCVDAAMEPETRPPPFRRPHFYSYRGG